MWLEAARENGKPVSLALVALRPEWGGYGGHGEGDEAGSLKVVMTGSASDPLEWQPHIRNKARREALAQRFRDPRDPFRIVIVRAQLRVYVKRILRKYGYPPDKQEQATRTVLEQAEVLSEGWVG